MSHSISPIVLSDIDGFVGVRILLSGAYMIVLGSTGKPCGCGAPGCMRYDVHGPPRSPSSAGLFHFWGLGVPSLLTPGACDIKKGLMR